LPIPSLFPYTTLFRSLVRHGNTARLILPIAWERAQALGEDGQRRLLDDALAESWWGHGRVLLKRTPSDWGRNYTLYRDSMNAVRSEEHTSELQSLAYL